MRRCMSSLEGPRGLTPACCATDEDSKNERAAHATHITDVDLFEQEQLTKANFLPSAGAGAAEQEDEYEYVFDEEQRINFVMQADRLEDAFGMDEKDAKLQEQIKAAQSKGECESKV